MNKINRSLVAVAVGAALMQAPASTLAQESDTEKSDSDIERIQVTASGRQQRPEEIPYNISAISGEELIANQINNETDLLRSLSGIGVVDRGYRAAGSVNNIIIRGLNVDGGQAGDNANIAPAPVSTYIGNTPMYANFIIRDINRVEALRGPQGTLYGSSSLGGTIRFIPNDPEMEYNSGELAVDYGQTSGSEGNNLMLDFTGNLALTENLALRGHIGRIDNDGFVDYVNAYQLNEFREPLIRNGDQCIDPRNAPSELIVGNVVAVRDSFANDYTPGSAPGVEPIGAACTHEVEDADFVEINHGRLALKWEAADNFEAKLAYQYQKIETGGRSARTPGDNGQPVDSEFYQAYGDDDIGFVLPEPSEDESELVALDLQWDLDVGTVTSTTSWFKTQGFNERDNGGLWSGGNLDFLYTGWSRPAQRTVAFYDNDAVTQEIRLTSKVGEQFDWIVGLFYLDETRRAGSDSLNPGMGNFWNACTTDPAVADACAQFAFGGLGYLFDTNGNYLTNTENDFVYRRNEEFKETAIYGEINYRPADKWELTLGARFFDNEAKSNGTFGFPIFAAEAPAEVPDFLSFLNVLELPENTQDESDVLLKLNVSYQMTPEAMIYGTVSEGFRRGGVNAIVSSPSFPIPDVELIQPFEKDTVINYEFGVKGRTDDFSYTLAAFYIDWTDPQINTATDWGFLVALNGDSAATYGIETEISGEFGDDWGYRLGYTYTNAEITADFVDPRGNGAVFAQDGDQLPGTPEQVINAGLNKTWDMGAGDYMTANLNIYHQGESENSPGGRGPFAQTFESFTMINASIAYIYNSEWTFTLYARNLTNEFGTTGSQPAASRGTDHRDGIYEGWYGNANIEYLAQPRTIGISGRYKF